MSLRESKKLWGQLEEVFSAPIVYHPGGWEDTVPADLRREVLRQRLGAVFNGGWDHATNAEATCYLSTACYVFPFNGDWTDIYTWLVAQWMPQVRQSVSDIPEVLKPYQEQLLRGLQIDIRRKQKTRKNRREEVIVTPDAKESTVFEGTIVIKAQPEGTTIMVGKADCDPHIHPIASSPLSELLEVIPGIMVTAEEHWAENQRNPKYVKPRTTRAKRSTGSETTAPATAELPLLGTPESTGDTVEAPVPTPKATAPVTAPGEPEQMNAEGATLLHQASHETETPLEEGELVTEERTEVTEEPIGGETLTEIKCPQDDFEGFSLEALQAHYKAFPDHEPVLEEPAAEEEPGAPEEPASEEPPEPIEPETSSNQPEEKPAATTESAPATAAGGGWVYHLKDTGDPVKDKLGPFYNTADALTALGSPAEERGRYWNRWDRLPKKYQNQIERSKE